MFVPRRCRIQVCDVRDKMNDISIVDFFSVSCPQLIVFQYALTLCLALCSSCCTLFLNKKLKEDLRKHEVCGLFDI